MAVYTPTDAEIDAVIGPALDLHPELSDALLEAAAILRMTPRSVLALDADGEPAHRLAYQAYREIVTARLHERMVGNAAAPVVCAAARRAANAAVLHRSLGDTVLLTCYRTEHSAEQTFICAAVQGPGGVTFATEYDLAQFAHFLAQAGPLPRGAEKARNLYERLTWPLSEFADPAQPDVAVLGVLSPALAAQLSRL